MFQFKLIKISVLKVNIFKWTRDVYDTSLCKDVMYAKKLFKI